MNIVLVLSRCQIQSNLLSTARRKTITYIFHEVPVEHVVVGESLSVEQVPDQLSEVSVVRLLLEPEGPHVVVIGGELSWKNKVQCHEN